MLTNRLVDSLKTSNLAFLATDYVGVVRLAVSSSHTNELFN